MNRIIIFFCIGLLGLVSCNEPTPTAETNDDNKGDKIDSTTLTKEETTDLSSDNKFLITASGLSFIKIGALISDYPKHLKEGVLENGEGDFPGYDLLDENQEKIGFVFPKHDDESLVGPIQIYSPLYKTKEGIGIGSTFAELKKAYPNRETHGSEIESRTSTEVGGLSFRLDAYFSTHKIDESTIKLSTKILQISISGAD
ncbi:MAG: hypothetical protein GY810_04735 [Aureispira sp.]|nr:hypothetical protein [Aureispira sp.]